MGIIRAGVMCDHPKKPSKHDFLVEAGAKFLRQKHHKVVLKETISLFLRERPDVLGYKLNGLTSNIECKSSRSDFHRDKHKISRKAGMVGIGNYRYYLTPPKMLKPDEVPEKWGLLEFDLDKKRAAVHEIKSAEYFESDEEAEKMLLVQVFRQDRNGGE